MSICFQEIWLFGSYARGDETDTSDFDVLVVADRAPNKTAIANYIQSVTNTDSLSVSHYTATGISALIATGSLFAWHIRLEGKPLFSSSGWLANSLTEISPYKAYRSDLAVLQAMVEDVRRSLESDNYTLHLEASILGVALRNAAMMLAFIGGTPNFSANSIFAIKGNLLVAPIFQQIGGQTIADLIKARLASERGIMSEIDWKRLSLISISKHIACWLHQLSQIAIVPEGYYATPVSTSTSPRKTVNANCKFSATG